MITQKSILDAVNLELVGIGHNWTVYLDALPKDFDRPSYYMSLGERTERDATRWSREVTQDVRVLCIGTLDEDGNAETDALTAAADEVCGLFADGFLRVGDRALHIDGSAAKRPADDGIEVTATLHYFDEAPGEADTEPVITEVQTRVDPKEG